jgi:hypothetical protein
LGYITKLPPGLTLSERVSKTEHLAKFGIVVVLPTDTPDEVALKEEEAERNWNRAGRRASWGCQWFVEWKANIEAAVRLNQRLQIYFFEGQVGKGILEWEELSAEEADPWDGVGIGGSQKGEVAWIKKNNFPYDFVDVKEFENDFVKEAADESIFKSWGKKIGGAIF